MPPRRPRPAEPVEAGLVERYLGVFRYSGHAIKLVWSTSWKLTVLIGALTLIAGVLPAAIAFVGKLTGKTTLIKLLTRLYLPWRGRILLDGTDLRDWDMARLHERIGVIFQDFVRYQFKVGENIGVGDVAHIEDEARWAEAGELMTRGGTYARLFDPSICRRRSIVSRFFRYRNLEISKLS